MSTLKTETAFSYETLVSHMWQFSGHNPRSLLPLPVNYMVICSIYLVIQFWSLKTFGWESEYRFFPTRPQRHCAWLPPLSPFVTFPFSLFPLSFWYSCRQRGGVQCGKQAAGFVSDHTCSFFPWLESRKLVIQYVCHLFDNSFHTQWFRRAFDALFV